MSLNVCVYSKLAKASVQEPDDYDFDTQLFIDLLSVEEVDRFFPGRHEGVEIGVVYDFGMRCEFDLSYGDYNIWRDQLAELAGKTHSGAFHELIEFSDSEGVIGPVVSKKLVVDFSEFEEQAQNVSDAFHQIYMEFKRAFEMSADQGAVQFQ